MEAQVRARVGEVGGAHFLRAVGGVVRDFSDGVGEFAQVAAQQVGQQGIEIGKMSSHGAGAHAQGLRETREGHGVDAAAGQDGLRDRQDAGELFRLTRGEVGRVALELFGVGAEDSVWGAHGGRTVVLGKFGCQALFFLRRPYSGRAGRWGGAGRACVGDARFAFSRGGSL